MPQIGAMTLQHSLQGSDRDSDRVPALRQCEMGGGAGRFSHDEATTAHARRRLAFVAHRGAASGDEQIAHCARQQHAVGKLIKAA